MSTISTHVLDTALGTPARGVGVALERLHEDGSGVAIGGGETDADGRVRDLVAAGTVISAGDYRLRFETGRYLAASGREVFYPAVTVDFRLTGPDAHYHVPLLLSPFGYSTYRGS
ncbi:MAG: hydroxyisourate hydrolase [Gemmatimonadaceae bacterium]|nr:hydroxyisourate hydrolase [Gemmatimonadaceae bacterium]